MSALYVNYKSFQKFLELARELRRRVYFHAEAHTEAPPKKPKKGENVYTQSIVASYCFHMEEGVFCRWQHTFSLGHSPTALPLPAVGKTFNQMIVVLEDFNWQLAFETGGPEIVNASVDDIPAPSILDVPIHEYAQRKRRVCDASHEENRGKSKEKEEDSSGGREQPVREGDTCIVVDHPEGQENEDDVSQSGEDVLSADDGDKDDS